MSIISLAKKTQWFLSEDKEKRKRKREREREKEQISDK